MAVLQKQQADRAVLNGQDFFRLNQEIESGGDMYEINTSSKALVVGPQSDLSSYTVNYLDLQSPDSINSVKLAVDNPVIGRIDALLDTNYPTAKIPAFVLVSPRDLVDNNWVPSDFVAAPPNNDIVAARPIPRIDLFAYLKDPPVVSPLRDDRVYRFPFVAALPSPARAFYILPYYGRRYGEFSFANLSGGDDAQTYTIRLEGINLFPGTQGPNSQAPGTSKYVATSIGGSAIVAPGEYLNREIVPDTQGMFDLISISIKSDLGRPDFNSVMQLLVSDKVS
jgi:hypothetical protein